MIYIVLPAYNEEKTLPPLLDSIRDNLAEVQFPYSVLVVDDGSMDNTAQIAEDFSKKMPLHLVRHPANKGLAEAFKTGLLEALKLTDPKDIIVTMDADNTQPPGLISRMVRMIREGYDVVIGSRYQPGARVIGVPIYRKFLSYAASAMFRILFPTRGVKDYTSGFRAYRAATIKGMYDLYGDQFVSESGFSCMVDVLLKLRKHAVIIGEAPLILRYDLKEGASKMNVAKTIRDTLALAFRRFFNRT